LLQTVSTTMRDRVAMYNDNALKIGLFGMNCSSARSATTVPERWSASWPDCLRIAQMADAAGIDFLLPVARWKGYGGETDFHGATLETVTWAASLLAATQRITVFGTVHAPLFHPLVAAKQFVTADLVGQGRFGLNVVCGWNEGEFEMFGVFQRDLETRYEYAQEWIDAIKAAWTEPSDFDLDGTFFQLRNVRAFPKPHGNTRPLIMNAGASGVGQAFALRNCDAFFTATASSRLSVAENAKRVGEIKQAAQALGREIDVYTVGQVICRPTQAEADDYYRHAMIDNADWGAVERMLELKNVTRATVAEEEFQRQRAFTAAKGIGGYPFVGTPEKIAGELADLSHAGLRGIAFSFVNYIEEFPLFRDEVLPRLVEAGVRTH
jgi:alkanesulfonate monooxygenase SsuD/methylene tetrahydromethanopterin reductase-like flavin-dependent oxidoreductase (luciferase family)